MNRNWIADRTNDVSIGVEVQSQLSGDHGKSRLFVAVAFKFLVFIVFVFPLLARRTKNGSSRLDELLSLYESGPPKKRGVAEEVLHTQRHDATTVRDKKQASARLLVNEAALSAGCK